MRDKTSVDVVHQTVNRVLRPTFGFEYKGYDFLETSHSFLFFVDYNKHRHFEFKYSKNRNEYVFTWNRKNIPVVVSKRPMQYINDDILFKDTVEFCKRILEYYLIK